MAAAAGKPTPGPPPAFGSSAPMLAPIAGQVKTASQKAKSGSLQLDDNTAEALLATLAELEAVVNQLIRDSQELDAPLKLGANFVGRVMAERLREAATGAAAPVLQDFALVLDDLELTVRAASKKFKVADEDARDQLAQASERLEEISDWKRDPR